ncbi:MAG TPA: hypothetical protein VGJ86_02820 [Acidimicrobiales bacterium]
MLATWEREATDDIIGQLSPVGDPTERLRLVMIAAMNDEDPQARHRARLAYSAYLGWFELSRAQAHSPPSSRDRAAIEPAISARSSPC